MIGCRLLLIPALGLVLGVRPALAQHAAGPDSARLAQAQQLAGAGNGAAARSVVDSVLAIRQTGTPEYAEALYWRAMLASTAADAERAYLTVAIEYSLSPRASDALLRLAQLEEARGDRASARRHLARLVRDHPAGAADPRAGLWAARLLFDENDAPAACTVLTLARAGIAAGDVELTNQVDYAAQRCVGVETSGAGTSTAAAGSAARAATDTGAGGPPRKNVDTAAARARNQSTAVPIDSTRELRAAELARLADSARGATAPRASAAAPGTPATGRSAERAGASGYSVQIAAYRSRGDADALAARLARRGYEARVIGTTAPFRVRVGHFATRAGAAEMQRILSRAKIDGMIVTDAASGARSGASTGTTGARTPKKPIERK